MPLPFFYTEQTASPGSIIALSEENAKHIVQVLRMQPGEKIKLTTGKGDVCTAEITEAHKKKCSVIIKEMLQEEASVKTICIAVSPVKNAGRFEWFLEKATELGVTEIVPLLCTRTEKQHLRYDRMKGILVSAMLQSQQAWLPILHQPAKYNEYVKQLSIGASINYIAHCDEGNKQSLKDCIANLEKISQTRTTVLIGPEGDFTKEEISSALQNNFTPVSLGTTRLRTETAAMVAATLLCMH